MPLTAGQINTLEIIERTNASISAISTIILLTTFCTFKAFRSLSNTLIFYASFANLFANVAALIGRSAIHNPNGALCQFQAFLLEMFMQSDPMWSCAMAVNVYLCFFRRYDPIRLRKLHWIYAVLCYGIPFIPAIFCLFWGDDRGKMYGDATLWCWIGNKYSDVRIYSYYLPIWISIVISLTIYFRVGFVLYKVRAQIRAFENENSEEYTTNSGTDVSRRTSAFAVNAAPEKKKEPQINHQSDRLRKVDTITEDENDYGISRWDSADVVRLNFPQSPHFNKLEIQDEEQAIFTTFNKPPTHISSPSPTFQHHPTSPLDPTYTHPSHRSPSISSDSTPTPSRHATNKMDKLKWAYTKSALLFTISILITWIPASINRAQGLTHPREPNYVLNIMSAFVLPLQGFWNTVIFFSTSWGVVKRVWRRWRRRVRDKRKIVDANAAEERRSSERTLTVDVV